MCAYLPYDDPATPAHCHSNAMFEATANNPHGAKFYGTPAVSNVLFQDTNGNGWLGEGCGRCYKVTGTSNIAGYSGIKTTHVLKASNYCPPGNPMCSRDKAHFDIAGKITFCNEMYRNVNLVKIGGPGPKILRARQNCVTLS